MVCNTFLFYICFIKQLKLENMEETQFETKIELPLLVTYTYFIDEGDDLTPPTTAIDDIIKIEIFGVDITDSVSKEIKGYLYDDAFEDLENKL